MSVLESAATTCCCCSELLRYFTDVVMQRQVHIGSCAHHSNLQIRSPYHAWSNKCQARQPFTHVSCKSTLRQALVQLVDPRPSPSNPAKAWWQGHQIPLIASGALAVYIWNRIMRKQHDQELTDLLLRQQERLLEHQQQQEQQQQPETHQVSETPTDLGVQGLGRVIVVARYSHAPSMQSFWQSMLDSSHGRLKGPAPTGLILVYRSCCLMVLEAGNNQLMSMIRRLQLSAPEQHGLLGARVISFVLDAQMRLFNNWTTCEVKMRDLGVPSVLQEQIWASSVRDMEMFARAAGNQMSGMTQDMQDKVTRDPLLFFGDKLPAPRTVLSLAAAELGPTLRDFLDSFDIDYHRYCNLRQQSLQHPGALQDPDWQWLNSVYEDVWRLEHDGPSKPLLQEAENTPTISPLAHLYPKPRVA